jgi:uncharacterized membrane protein
VRNKIQASFAHIVIVNLTMNEGKIMVMMRDCTLHEVSKIFIDYDRFFFMYWVESFIIIMKSMCNIR